MNHYSRLIREQRYTLQAMKGNGASQKEIAAATCRTFRPRFTVKILKRLRSKGPVTTSELLKNFHLKKQERDPLLQRLAGENLLQVADGEVSATTYRQFVEGLYRREEFPPVVDEWVRLKAELKVAAKQGA